MEVLRDFKSLEAYVRACGEKNRRVGFVPTMGALHPGHISLCKAAKKENDVVICSIFVNPTQFNHSDDLRKYPRDEKHDLQMLSNEGIHGLYLPRIEEIYPDGLKAEDYDFGGLDREMEGRFRPGHFSGVATVVERLLRQVRPKKAYFGEKDFQQLVVVDRVVKRLKLPVEIVPVSTCRERNGLAMSSRNSRLTENEREEAGLIHTTLSQVSAWLKTMEVREVEERVEDIFSASVFSLEYFSISDEQNLKSADAIDPRKRYRAFIAVFCRDVRLIDNFPIALS